MTTRRVNRRAAMKTLAVGTASLAACNNTFAAAPSDRLTVGVIGLGSRGYNLLDAFLANADSQIVALCDVDQAHYRDRPWGKGPRYGLQPAKERVTKALANAKSATPAKGIATYRNYRDLIARDDIDVVVVATPDHWHAQITLDAIAKGKDVYCEKPVTHLFAEGQQVYRAVAKAKSVFQTGSQQRSDEKFRRAVEIVRSGLVGKVQRVEVGLPAGYEKPQGDTTITAPPDSLDYNLWCGPSPQLPYMRARHHRWWRGHRAYGGGVLMDWIGHHNDIAHWALDLDQSGPLTVEATDWSFPNTDVYDSPHHYAIRCSYPGGIKSMISSRNKQGLKVIGDEGWVYVRRGVIEASDSRWLQSDFQFDDTNVERSDDHVQNFIDCVKARQATVAPAETAHRSITPGHLGYVSQALGRPLAWDADAEQIVDDAEANQLLQKVNYRSW